MVAALVGETPSVRISSHLHALARSGPDAADSIGSIAGTDSLLAWLQQHLAGLARPLTSPEWETLATLQDIQQTGRVRRTWTDVQFSVNARLAREILANCAGDTIIGLGLEGGGRTLDLFGRSIALGRERLLFFQAQLIKQGALRANLGAKPDDNATVMLYFAPGENDAVESAYFDTPSLLGQPFAEGIASDTSESRKSESADASLSFRSGPWRILTTPPLRAPVELAPTDEAVPSGWRLDVTDRVLAKLRQLDDDERAAVLNLLWGLQRRGGREYLNRRSIRVDADLVGVYVVRATPDLRVILRPLTETTLTVAEIVYAETLQMFRER